MANPTFLFNLTADNIGDALSSVLEHCIESQGLDEDASTELSHELKRHADLGPDHIEQGVAIIHQQTQSIDDVSVFVQLADGIPSIYGRDNVPLRFIWVLFSRKKTHPQMARASEFIELLKDASVRAKFESVADSDTFNNLFSKSVDDVIHHKHHLPDELKPTGRFAGALVDDVKRTVSTYGSDFKDGFNSKSLASVFFLFFACLAPAIAFGGLLESLTGGAVGVTEMIVATALCGVSYALFSAQPLTILGSTGPVIIFMGILYPLCIQYNIPYLPTLACVGLWTMVFLIVLTLLDACSWIRFFTRFTDETFAALISLIFIYEALKKMLGGFTAGDSNLAIAFFALLLGLGTFYIASRLSALRSSDYLRRSLREFLADFGTTIAIVLMLLLSLASQFQSIEIARLEVPDKLAPTSAVMTVDTLKANGLSEKLSSVITTNPSVVNTNESLYNSFTIDDEIKTELTKLRNEIKAAKVSGEAHWYTQADDKRSWFVNPLEAPPWVIWMSIIPALLLSILLYLDQNITVRLVNHSQYKLKKGAGYHLDMLIVSLLVGVCSILGLPWMVAATVRSLNHVRSLLIFDTSSGTEEITGTVETRLTGVLVHTAVGLSLLALALLKLIPMAVLFGLFLYMGIASMKGNQLFERLRLWIVDPSKYPPTYYLRAVPVRRVHLYTLVQSISLALLWIIKTSAIALLFPLFIAILVPIRMSLNKFFDHTHLALLDAEEEPDEEEFQESM
ncbi:MAG: sodium bicarbonate transporter family protein [Myxococcota bacterium]|nr:sodium bicarbonate transporter family protein [Myxococcota bacterium]